MSLVPNAFGVKCILGRVTEAIHGLSPAGVGDVPLLKLSHAFDAVCVFGFEDRFRINCILGRVTRAVLALALPLDGGKASSPRE